MMSRAYRGETGQALTELALILPLLVILFLGLIEAGSALKAYLTVVEASRDGARLVAREGSSADVKGLVQMLTERLSTSDVRVQVTYDEDELGGQMVTVEVHYDYKLLFGRVSPIQVFASDPLPLTARSTMPIP
jgi:Flp pilus assembly protein TadG